MRKYRATRPTGPPSPLRPFLYHHPNTLLQKGIMTIIVGFLTLRDEAGIWNGSLIEFREKFQLINKNKNPSILILILRL